MMPPPTHQLDDGEAMVDAAAGGLEFVQLPISLVRGHVEASLLQAVLDRFSSVDVEIHAIWPRQAHLSPRVRYLVDQLLAYAARGRLS